ncbi:MAG: DUF501 domain-containing protein [Ilumatobacter sp.]|uniref:DUF501 domain-containing protein n=1 Tax=Ilumatobacter sp. TaxID=1967498 RepID=UPI002611302C|nr:DUF501 domain-containing protein [Ilumatobacter sp.]MDJ0767734.1 DUF501 domain-containing protein [Ilumatobacter sp.]
MTRSDDDRVRELLGREPRGDYDVVVRDPDGDPVVLRNAPLLGDGTPMPTRYWLVGPEETRRIGRLEAEGGVDAAEAAVDAAELAAAHDRYAAERDAAIPADHAGPRPSGGVGGTRQGVKCLHAHWAWHLAGGNDPVGRWIADALARERTMVVAVAEQETSVGIGLKTTASIPWGPESLTDRWLRDDDPPRPEALTNALGTVTDHLDDIIREHPEAASIETLSLVGPSISALARLEVGADHVPDDIELHRDDAEEIFRIVATEPAVDRAHNPGLPSRHVETIVATCCIVLALMRRLHLDHVRLGVA